MLSRSPCHHKASTYARSGLFKSLDGFAELERRIAQLPTEQERGDAFEVFVEAYLSTAEMVQATDVWVNGTVPAEHRQRLNLPARDYGYDGVFRTKLGELVPYQVKFRSNCAPLPYAELATFFGISEKAERRVVLTNSIAVSAIAESRTSFQTTRGGDFDCLDAAQLDLIATWIDGITPAPLLREPRPHQRAALNDIEGELANRDRATVVMACGTGKTLVALWAAESANPRRVLVLVPSLNLLRQTLHEWAKWTDWGGRFRFLCVCSDPRVGKGLDEIEVRPEDADFPVRTDPAIVRHFLDTGGDDVSVVFCTYQSAPVVGEAMVGRQPFDLGIFDEAHKTTGREGTRFGYALTDRNLPIKKRLFLTATPRHYDISKRDRDGDFAVVTMDDEAIYGHVAHRLTFASAAAQRIIVPYKVVISIVDSEMIDNALMDQSEVSVEGDPIRAKWVAHQIALKRAVEEHNLRRIITFHSSIRAAAAFASDGTAGVGIHLRDFQRFHVSGEQPTAERDEHMREFAQAPRGVITNARCLTEGVDVPSVDMVAFMNPRRSRVDIVQAVGRAMRTADEEKTCGYVLIPLFLETRQGETLDEALERSDFREIAQVLNAMRENDDDLNDVIEAFAVERGRTGGYDESRLRDKVEVLGPQLRLADLSSAIRIRLIDELSIAWDERYGQLIAYKQANGDCDVPQDWAHSPGLGHWCSRQRASYKSNALSAERAGRLEQLGFIWDPLTVAWEEMFTELTAYQQAHGDCEVPQRWEQNPALGTWCRGQRRAYNDNHMSFERVARMEKIGFVWDPLHDVWEEMYAQLLTYRKTHGNCNVPRIQQGTRALGTWVHGQRRLHQTGKLSDERTRRLEQLGIVWNTFSAAWEKKFEELVSYKQTFGDCNVPQGWRNNPELGGWCTKQRGDYKRKKSKLSADQIKRLEQLGFIWDPLTVAWEEMFTALTAYKRTHGDCDVPTVLQDSPKLPTWCRNLRTAYKAGKLSGGQIARLESLGFVWTPNTADWENMFAALTSYKHARGDCNVPREWPDNPALGMWCGTQRYAYKTNKIPAERVARLERLGFVWDPLSLVWGEDWEENFAALAAFKEAYGHCNVPKGQRDKLGDWCSRQRSSYKTRKLSLAQIQRLEQLGFTWNPLAVSWEHMFAALAAYKHAHGDCNVPKRYRKGNPKLANWCANQRTAYKLGRLSPDRVAQLAQLGFVWDLLGVFAVVWDAGWEEKFAALTAYKQAHGDCDVPNRWKENPALGVWCQKQRSVYKTSCLPTDRAARLEQLGFVWDPITVAREQMFRALTAYKQAHGDCNVPMGWKGDPKLASWCATQRAIFRKGQLDPDRIKRLKHLGFTWRPLTVAWEEMFAALTAYKQTRGDCYVPQRYEGNQNLGAWCATQRAIFRKGQLDPDRIKRLEHLGFTWRPLTVAWEEMFSELMAYVAIHGHCNVPQRYKDNRNLGAWCATQRAIFRNGQLDSDRIKRLEQLGFVLDPHTTAWNEMFVALTAYKQAHGHCKVPKRWKENPALETWCLTQRANYNTNHLPAERVALLEQIGFTWDPYADAWDEMLTALAAHKQAHGDCNAPIGSDGNSKLAIWRDAQRAIRKKGKLDPDRVTRLEDLGFRFAIRESQTK